MQLLNSHSLHNVTNNCSWVSQNYMSYTMLPVCDAHYEWLRRMNEVDIWPAGPTRRFPLPPPVPWSLPPRCSPLASDCWCRPWLWGGVEICFFPLTMLMAHRLYNSCDYILTYLSVCVCVLSDCKGGREWTECGGCVWTCTNLLIYIYVIYLVQRSATENVIVQRKLPSGTKANVSRLTGVQVRIRNNSIF